jgi:hypothetical protein
VDDSGNVVVVGWTRSGDFPTTVGAPRVESGGGDGFVSKLDPSASQLAWSTLVGGAQEDQCLALALDAFGNAWVAGRTGSNGFPSSPNSFQRVLAGGQDGFLIELEGQSGALSFASFFGLDGDDALVALAIDRASGEGAFVGHATRVPNAQRTVLSGRRGGASDTWLGRFDTGSCTHAAAVRALNSPCGADLSCSVPRLGADLELEVRRASPGSWGFLLFGFEGAPIVTLEGLCDVYVDLEMPFLLGTFTTDDLGNADLSVAIEEEPILCDVVVVVQGAVMAPGTGPLTFGQVTNAVQLTFGD